MVCFDIFFRRTQCVIFDFVSRESFFATLGGLSIHLCLWVKWNSLSLSSETCSPFKNHLFESTLETEHVLIPETGCIKFSVAAFQHHQAVIEKLAFGLKTQSE